MTMTLPWGSTLRSREPGALEQPVNAASVKVVPGRATVGYCRAGVKDPWARLRRTPGRRDRMPAPLSLVFSSTTPQSVLPWAAHRTPVTGSAFCVGRSMESRPLVRESEEGAR